ncbi:hypothetical protein RND81_11G216200 [Saponaria officinalis]|uniref:Uncharacterized protein n=1 Tax=Saponaria officinalis TaxID=3572 RepID=A0AAW1HQ36_SAPOF
MSCQQNEKSSQNPEVKVHTVDNRESAGQMQQQRDIDVIHQLHQPKNPATSGSLLTGAVVSAVDVLQSAKKALSGDR